MAQPLINLSPDLRRLHDEGFELEIRGVHLLVHHLPYVTPKKEVKNGILVCALTLASPTRTGKPGDHTAYFIGETPCLSDGTAMTAALINHSNRTQLKDELWGDHYFSSKPARGFYEDYYEKVWTYAEILCAQAKVIDSSVTYKLNKRR